MNQDIVVIFTSTNTHIAANNNTLGFVQSVEVEDVNESGEKYTKITLHRLVNDNEDIINDMRSAPFSFKIFNVSTGGGYITPEAEVIGFKMHLAAKKDANPVEFLEQTIVLKTKSFLYVQDTRSEEMKAAEENDLVNLINIIKTNQAKNVTKPDYESFVGTKPNASVVRQNSDWSAVNVEDKDLVWLNAKDPKQIENTKPRKIKKTKKRA